MTTTVEIKLWSAEGSARVESHLQKAQEEFFRIANTYTRFNPTSQLSQLNKKNGETVKVTDEMFYLVATMLEFARFSDGAYDPTIIDLLELQGYKSSFNPKEIVAVQKEVVSLEKYLAKRPSWRQLEINPDDKTIKLAPNQRLDLGGIGKGYAIDLAASTLKSVSENFLISAGGDVYGLGHNLKPTDQPQDKQRWSVDLRLPEEKTLGKVLLDPTGQAVASSGSWARSVGKFHHLLDPKTGAPANTNLQAFVSHANATTADALATIVFVAGTDIIDNMADTYLAEALIVTTSGQIWSTDHFPLS